MSTGVSLAVTAR